MISNVVYIGDPSLKEAMWEFHRENPHVMEKVVEYTFEAIRAGFKHYSMVAIFNRIRWHYDMETTDETFKLNNNHIPYYARFFHALYPEYEGFFRTRVAEGEV